MKKLILFFLLTGVAINQSQGQTSVWKVSSGNNYLYLGGTVHILRESDYPLPAEFDSAYANADMIVQEADIGKMEDPGVAQALLMKAMYQDERTLQTVLSEDTYKALEAECIKMNIPLAAMAKFKPSMVIMTLTVFKMQQKGMTSDGVDKYFYTEAKKEEKPVAFLETMDEQMELISSLGEGNEDEFVMYSLEDMDSVEAVFKMTEEWRTGTADYIIEKQSEMKEDYPDIYQSILVKRNDNWIPKIETYLDDEPIEFIMVGAMHLPGPDGVIQKLKDKGYSVEPLEY